MRILFEIGLGPHIRHYDNVVEELRRRGHDVVVTATLEDSTLFEKKPIDQDHRNVTVNFVYLVREPWAEQTYLYRCVRDFIRYLDPEYDGSTILRGRMQNMLKFGLSEPYAKAGAAMEHFVRGLPHEQRRAFSAALGALDAAAPPSEKLAGLFRRHRPDLYLITPLIFTQYGQFELLKCAKALGITTGYMVFSWDNISTKGILHLEPDAIFLWNAIQEAEVRRLYGSAIPVYKCGAPRFDYFFEKKPSRSREDFFRCHDLDPARPLVTYLCSSNLVSSAETGFVSKWLAAMDAAPGESIKTCNVIVRPHPKFRSLWEGHKFPESRRKVSVVASERLNNDQTLFDTLYFSSAVVGLNTSAQLESAVLGKPVFTIRVPEYSEGQAGTIHFHYLLKENGGFVEHAESPEANARQLMEVLEGRTDRETIRKFVEMFIRPQGMDKPAAVATAEAIEDFQRPRSNACSVTAPGGSRLKRFLKSLCGS